MIAWAPIAIAMVGAAALCVGLALAAPADAAPERDSHLASIKSPRSSALVRSSSVHVAVRTAKRLSSFRVELDGANVTGRLRSTGNVREGRLHGLKVGSHILIVSSARGGREDLDAVRFFVGRRDASVLRLGAPAAAGGAPVPARLRVRGEVRRLRARLNGHPIGNRFRTPTGVIVPASLSSSDGLHYGRNVLRVVALRKDHRYDVERRTITVTRARPLVGAGVDRLATTGDRVVLDGRDSTPRSKGTRLTYRWRITRKPGGSKVILRRATSARPSLRPDRRGRYRVALTVTERGAASSAGGAASASAVGAASASDSILVAAQPPAPPIGVPVSVLRDGIQVGGDTYPPPVPNASPPAFQVVVLDRRTLEPAPAGELPAPLSSNMMFTDDLETLPSALQQLDSSELVLVQGTGPLRNELFPFGAVLDGALAAIGGEPLDSRALDNVSEGSIAAIGIPGTSAGTAWVNENLAYDGLQRGEIAGYLALDSNNNYAFQYGDYRPFDTSVPGAAAGANTINVDGVDYSGSIGGADGGFQVVALDSGNLDRLDAQTFVTNTGQAAIDQTAQEQLFSWLATYASNPNALVLMQSIGTPTPTTPAWGEVAKQVELLGGSRQVFNTATEGYTLVGGAGVDFPADEQSPALTGGAPRLTGLIDRSHRGRWEPLLSDPVGGLPYDDILQLAYQAPKPWPVGDPQQGTAGELAAGAAIAQALSPKDENGELEWQTLADLRAAYWSDPNADWGGTLLTDLNRLSSQGGEGYSAADFSSVQQELGEEFGWVDNVNTLFGVPGSQLSGNLQAPLLTDELGAYDNLQKIASQVEQAVAPPDESNAVNGLTIMEGVLDIGWAVIPAGEGGAVAGVLDGGLTIAGAFATNSDGSPILRNVEAKANELPGEFVDNLKTAASSFSQLGQLLTSDYGRLSVAGPVAGGTSWFDDESPANIGDLLVASTRQWGYEQLLPVAYQAWVLLPTDANPVLTTARSYQCFLPTILATFHKLSSQGSGELDFTTGFSASGDPVIGAIWALVERGWSPAFIGDVPPASLTDPLFAPISLGDTSQGAGVGLYKPWFFSNFGTRSLQCSSGGAVTIGDANPPGPPTPG